MDFANPDLTETVTALEADPNALLDALIASEGLLVLRKVQAITDNPELMLSLSRLSGPQV